MTNSFFRATKKGFTPLQTAQLQAEVSKRVQELQDECLNKGFMFSLSVCLDLLQADEYFGDRSKELLPKFVKELIEMWDYLSRDLLTMEEVSNSIYNLSGVRIHPEYFNRADKGQKDMIEVRE